MFVCIQEMREVTNFKWAKEKLEMNSFEFLGVKSIFSMLHKESCKKLGFDTSEVEEDLPLVHLDNECTVLNGGNDVILIGEYLVSSIYLAKGNDGPIAVAKAQKKSEHFEKTGYPDEDVEEILLRLT